MLKSFFLMFFFVSFSYADTPFVIGIAGGSGSGKTMLAKSLQELIGKEKCTVLYADNYYKPLSQIKSGFDSPSSIDFELLNKHLHLLKLGKAVKTPSYDFSISDRVGYTDLMPKKIIIVEGFLLFLDSKIRDQLNMSIFLDVDSDLLCLRRFERDLLTLNRPFLSVKENYLKHVKPGFEKHVVPTKQYSDVIINANLQPKNVVEQAFKKIKEKAVCLSVTSLEEKMGN